MPSSVAALQTAAKPTFSSITVLEPPPQVAVVIQDGDGQEQTLTVTGLTGPQVAELTLGDIVDAVKKIVVLVFGGPDKPPAPPAGGVTVNVNGGQGNVTVVVNNPS